MDKPKIEKAVRMILEAIGEDPDREGLRETPARVAAMYEEIFGGLYRSLEEDLYLYEARNHDEMIILKDIPFYSICEHHLLPFFGKAHVAYIPSQEKVTGISKIARVVDTVSRRPQLQERLTTEIAEVIMNRVKPKGVLVVIEAEHMCLTMRGIKKPGSLSVTSAMRGLLRQPATRAEAFALIKGVK
ncbi:MAG: GTP cyclohydrolase I FolE [candidate division NC10 bacterium]|nr:GTP cyclohydrolase I FolE [candidate division NC10 bacterium]